jgi:phosphatidylinositol alpha-1,6-mannosyltransferase
MGLGDRVRFAGYVPEAEKADHYRLADAFVMPGTGEGFGLVYLEAMACGVPVVASSADASSEAVLGGVLGEVVNPHDQRDVEAGILRALSRPIGTVPTGLERFSTAAFQRRWHDAIDDVFCRRTRISTERHTRALNSMQA